MIYTWEVSSNNWAINFENGSKLPLAGNKKNVSNLILFCLPEK